MDAEARRNEKALTAIMLLSTLFSKTATLCSTTAGVAFQKVFRHLIAFVCRHSLRKKSMLTS
jgi:hypothetical protein